MMPLFGRVFFIYKSYTIIAIRLQLFIFYFNASTFHRGSLFLKLILAILFVCK